MLHLRRECPLCFCLVYTWNNFQSHNLEKNCYKLGKSNNITFKKPSAEKNLALTQTQASKVNMSQKVRTFCGIHIKCINNTKKYALVKRQRQRDKDIYCSTTLSYDTKIKL